MAVELDLADIQGNMLTPYGKLGFPKGRFMLFHIGNPDSGRKFVTRLLPMITTALRWPSLSTDIPTGKNRVPRPEVAVNIAFTFYGLLALEIPVRSLRGMPYEFIDGMTARAPMLGDDFHEDWKERWDDVWTKSAQGYGPNANRVHILITLNAQMDTRTGAAVPALHERTLEIERLAEDNGITLLEGHNQPGKAVRRYQELSAILTHENGEYKPTPKEHFGFTDGISDPLFDGQYPNQYEQTIAKGRGALDGKGNWRPLATGEFLLGYPDEAQEIAGAAMPLDFSRNGTFMAYRKLHQNVAVFRDFIAEAAKTYAKVSGIENQEDARETLMAKMAGRWADGVPLSLAKNVEEWRKFQNELKHMPDQKTSEAALKDFKFRYPKNDRGESDERDDPDGIKCPLTSHLRRVNTRDMMGPTAEDGSVLANRRRVLRRGLPYGGSPEGAQDTEEHGIVMLIVCASLFRQFEFVQQQWINYGLDAGAGSDACPIVGNHSPGGEKGSKAKFVIPADPASGRPPFIVEGLPQFVEARGGEYFFVPSMTALRMIGMGVVDPT
jgi:Dyp-type peroxidase family